MNKGPTSSNPFGNAKPRENVLAEKGIDWRVVDERVERKAEEEQHHLFPTPANLVTRGGNDDKTVSKEKCEEKAKEGVANPNEGHDAADDDTSTSSTSSSSHARGPFGEARPREEILAEHGVDFKRIDERIESRATGGGGGERVFTPASSSSPSQNEDSPPGPAEAAADTARAAAVTKKKVKPRSNPFGNARPREEVLAGKGVDYRQVDRRLERKAAAMHLTEEQEAEAEVIRQELSNAQENYWDANEHEMPEEKFRVVCETKRKELHDLLERFSELNLRKQQQELETVLSAAPTSSRAGVRETRSEYHSRYYGRGGGRGRGGSCAGREQQQGRAGYGQGYARGYRYERYH